MTEAIEVLENKLGAEVVAEYTNKNLSVEQDLWDAHGLKGIAYGPWQEEIATSAGGNSAQGHDDPGGATTEEEALPPASPPEPAHVRIKRLFAALNYTEEKQDLSTVDFSHLLSDDRVVPDPLITYTDLGERHVFARQGEVIRVAGEPGVGKSFLLLEMTLAMRTGEPVAGMACRHSRVLWVDEEGDDDILSERLMLLHASLEDLNSEAFRYYLNQDIHLDRASVREVLFPKILDFMPDVIVIDSASRIHTLDENYAGDMAKLFNDGLKPLSRVFGASVFLIDHLKKSSDGPLDHRSRGSIEKSAQVDRNWILQKTDDTSFALAHGKTRRGVTPPTIKVRRHVANGALRHVTDGVV